MTREAFITKWLDNKAARYTEEFRDLMREDLDKVIDYHSNKKNGGWNTICENCGGYKSIHSASRMICPGGKSHFKHPNH